MLSKALDRLGISASIICLIHCLSLPIIAIFAPRILEVDQDHSWFHWVILVPVIFAATLGLWSGYRFHRHLFPVLLGFTGMGLLFTALVLTHERIIGTWGDILITLAGSLMLIRAHLYNLRHCQIPHPHA